MVEQNVRSGQDTSAEEMQRYKDKAARWKRALEEATSSTTARAPVPDSAKEKYWEKEARKYRQLYQDTNEKYKAELPSAEYIQLIRETMLENQKLVVADNENLKTEISQLKEYKAKMSKFGQEQRKYVQDLELSICTKQQQLNERKKNSDYPTPQRILPWRPRLTMKQTCWNKLKCYRMAGQMPSSQP